MPNSQLYLALEEGSPLHEIKALIAGNEASLLETNKNGLTPLFFALRKKVPVPIIELLATACPEAVTEPDDHGNLPVQYTLLNNFEEDSCVMALLKANPACLKAQDKGGNLPLHVAASPTLHMGNSEHATVLKMIKEFPDACKTKNKNGLLPLGMAARTSMHTGSRDFFEVLEALVRQFPQALLVNTAGRAMGRKYVLDIMCELNLSQLSPEFVLFMKDSCPVAFRLKSLGFHEQLPLSRAIRSTFDCGSDERRPVDHEAKVNAVLAIIEAYPPAAMGGIYGTRDFGEPLECAVGRSTRISKALLQAYPHDGMRRNHVRDILFPQARSRTELRHLCIIRFLVRLFPDCLAWKDDRGNTLLFRAVKDNFRETVDWLLSIHPELVRIRNHEGRLPLHVAFQIHPFSLNLPIVKSLCEAWPESCAEQDAEGKVPLALAVGMQNVAGVEYVLHTCPEATKVKDTLGRLPLYHAITSGSLVNTRVLVDSWPESLQVRDSSDESAMFHACELPATTGFMKLFVTACPESPRARNSFGELPIHVLLQTQDCKVSTAKVLIEAYPNSLHERDSYGRLPLHSFLKSSSGGLAFGLDVLRMVVNKCPGSVDTMDDSGDFPLFLACGKEYISQTGLYALVKDSINLFHAANCRSSAGSATYKEQNRERRKRRNEQRETKKMETEKKRRADSISYM